MDAEKNVRLSDREPLDPAKEIWCAGIPRGVYSVGLLAAKMEPPVRIS